MKASFSVNAAQSCAPFTVHCTSTSTGGVVNWNWLTSDGQTSTDVHHCFSQLGDITIVVHPKPQFKIKDSLIVAQKGDVNFIATTSSDNVTGWLWAPSLRLSCSNCAHPVLTAIKTTTYTGIASTDYGCTDTGTIQVHVLCNQNKIYISSGFTPNRDGRNDWFYVMSNIDNPVRSIVIYSRNGDRVFVKTNTFTNKYYARLGWQLQRHSCIGRRIRLLDRNYV